MRIEYHRSLIADVRRNAAFHAALKRVIVPGVSVVADIGAGTGLLGLMAARLGAKSVILYESEAVIAVARDIARTSRIHTCRFIAAHSTAVEVPERADIVVSETLGNYALEENIVATMDDARRRHLKPGGVLIPRRIEQHVALVTTPRFLDELDAWSRVGFDLDMTPALLMSRNNAYVRKFAREDLLLAGTEARRWDTIDFSQRNKSARTGMAEWRSAADAKITGAALWWTAELLPGIELSTSPLGPPTHWEQLYLPVLEPIAARAGDTLSLRIRSTTSHDAGTDIAWTFEHSAASGARRGRQSLDLAKGYLP